eukprot:29988_3
MYWRKLHFLSTWNLNSCGYLHKRWYADDYRQGNLRERRIYHDIIETSGRCINENVIKSNDPIYDERFNIPIHIRDICPIDATPQKYSHAAKLLACIICGGIAGIIALQHDARNLCFLLRCN